jgi:hypothetical protein
MERWRWRGWRRGRGREGLAKEKNVLSGDLGLDLSDEATFDLCPQLLRPMRQRKHRAEVR